LPAFERVTRVPAFAFIRASSSSGYRSALQACRSRRTLRIGVLVILSGQAAQQNIACLESRELPRIQTESRLPVLSLTAPSILGESICVDTAPILGRLVYVALSETKDTLGQISTWDASATWKFLVNCPLRCYFPAPEVGPVPTMVAKPKRGHRYFRRCRRRSCRSSEWDDSRVITTFVVLRLTAGTAVDLLRAKTSGPCCKRWPREALAFFMVSPPRSSRSFKDTSSG